MAKYTDIDSEWDHKLKMWWMKLVLGGGVAAVLCIFVVIITLAVIHCRSKLCCGRGKKAKRSGTPGNKYRIHDAEEGQKRSSIPSLAERKRRRRNWNPLTSTPLDGVDGDSPSDSVTEIPRLDKSMTQGSFSLQNDSMVSDIHQQSLKSKSSVYCLTPAPDKDGYNLSVRPNRYSGCYNDLKASFRMCGPRSQVASMSAHSAHGTNGKAILTDQPSSEVNDTSASVRSIYGANDSNNNTRSSADSGVENSSTRAEYDSNLSAGRIHRMLTTSVEVDEILRQSAPLTVTSTPASAPVSTSASMLATVTVTQNPSQPGTLSVTDKDSNCRFCDFPEDADFKTPYNQVSVDTPSSPTHIDHHPHVTENLPHIPLQLPDFSPPLDASHTHITDEVDSASNAPAFEQKSPAEFQDCVEQSMSNSLADTNISTASTSLRAEDLETPDNGVEISPPTSPQAVNHQPTDSTRKLTNSLVPDSSTSVILTPRKPAHKFVDGERRLLEDIVPKRLDRLASKVLASPHTDQYMAQTDRSTTSTVGIISHVALPADQQEPDRQDPNLLCRVCHRCDKRIAVGSKSPMSEGRAVYYHGELLCVQCQRSEVIDSLQSTNPLSEVESLYEQETTYL